MTVLLAALVVAVVFTALNLYVTHRMLLAHQEIIARVIGRRASDLTYALEQAEERVTEAARYGVRARSGPARLRD